MVTYLAACFRSFGIGKLSYKYLSMISGEAGTSLWRQQDPDVDRWSVEPLAGWKVGLSHPQKVPVIWALPNLFEIF